MCSDSFVSIVFLVSKRNRKGLCCCGGKDSRVPNKWQEDVRPCEWTTRVKPYTGAFTLSHTVDWAWTIRLRTISQRSGSRKPMLFVLPFAKSWIVFSSSCAVQKTQGNHLPTLPFRCYVRNSRRRFVVCGKGLNRSDPMKFDEISNVSFMIGPASCIVSQWGSLDSTRTEFG